MAFFSASDFSLAGKDVAWRPSCGILSQRENAMIGSGDQRAISRLAKHEDIATIQSIAALLPGLAGIAGVHPLKYRVYISRPTGTTDHVRIKAQGDPNVVDPEKVKKTLALRLLFEPNEVEIVQEWEDGPTVVDERGAVDR